MIVSSSLLTTLRDAAHIDETKLMTLEQDKERLLDVLYAINFITGQRPSIIHAQADYLTDWSDDRLAQAARALDADRDILNSVTSMRYVDISTSARKRAASRYSASAPLAIQILRSRNFPVQRAEPSDNRARGAPEAVDRLALQAVIDLYHTNVATLTLAPGPLRRANAQVATIEAQLQDDPDPIIVRRAWESLKTIVEAALSGARGEAALNAREIWGPLIELF